MPFHYVSMRLVIFWECWCGMMVLLVEATSNASNLSKKNKKHQSDPSDPSDWFHIYPSIWHIYLSVCLPTYLLWSISVSVHSIPFHSITFYSVVFYSNSSMLFNPAPLYLESLRICATSTVDSEAGCPVASSRPPSALAVQPASPLAATQPVKSSVGPNNLQRSYRKRSTTKYSSWNHVLKHKLALWNLPQKNRCLGKKNSCKRVKSACSRAMALMLAMDWLWRSLFLPKLWQFGRLFFCIKIHENPWTSKKIPQNPWRFHW